MVELIHDPARMKSAFPLFQLHKSLGMLTFLATIARILVRLRQKTPNLPAGMPLWERVSALVAQAALYLLLIAVPLAGWLYISTEWAESLDKEFRSPTLFFGQFTVPYASFVSDASAGLRRALSFHLSGIHRWMAYGLLALIGLHGAAALKHHLVNKDEVLSHMLPSIRPRSGPRASPSPRSTNLRSARVWLLAVVSVIALAWLGWTANPAPSRVATGPQAVAAR